MREATIQKIEWIKPIENADNIEAVGILGWQIVVKKNEFRVGDICVYCELDSLLPEKPEFEFMRNKNFRVKSIKLRGELSQGLCLGINIFKEDHLKVLFMLQTEDRIGLDVSEWLGITHYEKPIPASMGGLVRGNFPPYISKTDETRIQSAPGVLYELKGIPVFSTIKMDGTSATYISKDEDFYVCSRNNSLKLEGNENNVYIQMEMKYNIRNKLQGRNIVIQGEICGPGIQKNKLNLKENDLYIFNVYDIFKREYLGLDDFVNFCDTLGFKRVPIIDIFKFDHTIPQLLEMAKGVYEGTKNRREGIVIRPIKEMKSERLKGRMSFKVLNNEYLMKDEE